MAFFNITSDSLLVTVAAMVVYTGYVFMPQHIMAILHYFQVVQWHCIPATPQDIDDIGFCSLPWSLEAWTVGEKYDYVLETGRWFR